MRLPMLKFNGAETAVSSTSTSSQVHSGHRNDWEGRQEERTHELSP